MALAGLRRAWRAARRATLPRGRSLRDNRRAQHRCEWCPADARHVRTGPSCGYRSPNISCSRECSGHRHRETRCLAAGFRLPGAAVRGICAPPRSQPQPRRACARSRRSHQRQRGCDGLKAWRRASRAVWLPPRVSVFCWSSAGSSALLRPTRILRAAVLRQVSEKKVSFAGWPSPHRGHKCLFRRRILGPRARPHQVTGARCNRARQNPRHCMTDV